MADTPWLDEREQCAWRAFLRMQAELAARLNRQLQTDSGLSLADYAVLAQLSEAPDGRLRPYELQRRLQWEQSRLSHHLARMQRRGHIRREECAVDGRGWFFGLTDSGRAAIEAAAPGHVEAVRRLFLDRVTRQQLAVLEQLSAQVLAALDSPEVERAEGR
jgi:DNA-binding MarR family transcriptional regulator